MSNPTTHDTERCTKKLEYGDANTHAEVKKCDGAATSARCMDKEARLEANLDVAAFNTHRSSAYFAFRAPNVLKCAIKW